MPERTVQTVPIRPEGNPAEEFARSAHEPFSALLESASGGRKSVIATRPWRVVASFGDRTRILTASGTRTRRGNPWDTLAPMLDEGTAIGWFGYDLGRFLERHPPGPTADRPLPDLYLAFYDRLIVHDHEEKKTRIVESRPRRAAVKAPGLGLDLPPAPTSIEAAFTRASYLKAIRRARDRIAAGDIYQVNLSQRFSAPVADDAWTLYRRLREASPAPYAAYFNVGEAALVSSSPELFLRIEGRRIETRPIKGTRPRGATAAEDARLRAELAASPKDDAELAMIVDLERNDIGRVCEFGSVKVVQAKIVESHPTVHHLVATIEGTLRANVSPLEALKAAFPGGSVTGCPKIRSMQIIDDLEPTSRGVYTGAFGIIGPGELNLGMGIRIATVMGGRVDFQVGGAIVADSDPDAEYQETLVKARGILRALNLPEEALAR